MESLPLPAAPLPRRGQQRTDWCPPANPTAIALALVERARIHDAPLLVVARDTASALRLEADCRALARGLPVLHLPDWETLPYDLFSPHPELISDRIATLHRLPELARGLLVVPVGTLLQRIAPAAWISGQVLDLRVGQPLELERERRRLQAAGYRQVPQVNDPGEFSLRGALLDLYPTGAPEPYRIELLDDRIESLRSFDPETQRSRRETSSLRLLPAREVALDAAGCQRARETLVERFELNPRRCPLLQDLKEGVAPAGIEYYLPLFFEHTASLFEYLPSSTLIALEAGWEEGMRQQFAQFASRYEARRHDLERPLLPPEELLLREDELRAALNRHPRIVLQADGASGANPPDLPLLRKDEAAGAALHAYLQQHPGRVLLAADSPGRREALLELLTQAGLQPEIHPGWAEFIAADSRFALTVLPLESGFQLVSPAITVLTERQLFPDRADQPRRRSRRGVREPDAILKDLSEISVGSPIVHEAHGVGRYRGLEVLETGGISGEYLVIEYAKGDKLYVPVAQLERVSRYSGASAEHAPLHSLGGETWGKARKRAAEKVRDVAAELLEIQARRKARAGLALPLDRAMYEPFAASFPFEETADQHSAIEAVIADLGQPSPMDRVVCGDVGFGKTEVAVRAAFVAAVAGRQVAVLVPTTLLAEQHYRTFRDRFADWPIRVEVLSRFKSSKDTKAVLEQVADGKIDVIVGTHRLLQADVRFQNLGLVIVDEEQRFGVQQKERLKALRAEVHLLTLTATPIPRTLNMAMSGLRDLSIIATPPAHRLAVKTFVAPWETETVIEAFQRELARGGQVYFLHNEVESIDKMARDLEVLVPDARIRIAHGQMPERELEQVMLDFHRQRFNVLVCTTIIESGIDIATANTILVNRADRFGLAQLHQLRGRVGRSHHRAYCYLIVPPKLTSDAEKRLEALAAIEELGAGFLLATHDLEIRGAGELLGEEQSGQIAEVGYALYTELLARAVKSIQAGRIPDLDAGAAIGPEINLNLPALLPDDYLPDVHTRLTLYKRISAADSGEHLRELQAELVDRFGVLPEPARHLFAVSELKLEAAKLGIRKLELGPVGGRLVFEAKPNIDPLAVIRMIQGQPKIYAMDGPEKLKLKLELPDAGSRLRAARALIATLQPG